MTEKRFNVLFSLKGEAEQHAVIKALSKDHVASLFSQAGYFVKEVTEVTDDMKAVSENLRGA